jgi:hypothetical protein
VQSLLRRAALTVLLGALSRLACSGGPADVPGAVLRRLGCSRQQPPAGLCASGTSTEAPALPETSRGAPKIALRPVGVEGDFAGGGPPGHAHVLKNAAPVCCCDSGEPASDRLDMATAMASIRDAAPSCVAAMSTWTASGS